MPTIKENIIEIKKEIGSVALIGVSKKKTKQDIISAIEAGVTDIGESYFQEAQKKLPLIKREFTKHFIGRIQSNKVAGIVKLFDIIQSVDRIKTAQLIDKESGLVGKKMPILIQVNISGENTKTGIKPDQIDQFVDECNKFPNLEIRGFMTIGPNTDDEKIIRKSYRDMKLLADFFDYPILSMGMTNDYMIAIQEGSTMIRLGTAIFGERQY